MCGGGGQTPQLPATPDPTPIPQPSNVNPQGTEGQKAQKNAMLKKGVISTIKTAPFGLTGTGPNLTPADPNAKKTLGA